MKTLATIIITILVVDFTGYAMWSASGQVPPDAFYIGAITQHILK